ncbi:MAG TPA: lysophospholipid acyltransferase family protein [Gemmatimonadaceae bacterium]
MIYRLLRWFTGIALHWFYSSIQVVGRERIPRTGPVIIAASHHNALVDALIAGWIAPRRLTLTAKATLLENPLVAWLFPLAGVVPLRRAKDEITKKGDAPVTRNAGAFDSILSVLAEGGMVLIFPEGISHSDPHLAPLKTGAARLALEARDKRGIDNLQIIPLGLNFEDKGNPGTAVLAEAGEPIHMDRVGGIAVNELTEMIATRLAAVSLKEPTPSPDRDAVRRKGGVHPLASPLGAWGELTHRYIVNYARDVALRMSKTPDEPAMKTIVLSLVLILLSYVVQFAIVAALAGPLWAVLYVATLPLGAYWAAYKNHPRPEAYA